MVQIRNRKHSKRRKKQKNVRLKKLLLKRLRRQTTRISNLAHIALQAIHMLITLGTVQRVTSLFLKKVAAAIVPPMDATMAHISLIFPI